MLKKEIERIWSLIADLAEAETSDEDEEMEEDTTSPKGAAAKGASSSDESGGGPKPFEPKVEVKAEAGLTTKSHFLFPFCENSLICLEGKSMTPHRENSILFRSSQQLPRLHLGPSTHLVRCFRNYRDTRTPSGVLR